MITFTLSRLANTGLSTWSVIRDQNCHIICNALERGTDNPEHPRILAGTYKINYRTIPSKFDDSLNKLLGSLYKGVLCVLDVPNRSNIEIHPANLYIELEGCIAPNMLVTKDMDGHYRGEASRSAYSLLYRQVAAALSKDNVELEIVDEVSHS